jgi:S-methyl-5-thioribose-1-phosphate isomerase
MMVTVGGRTRHYRSVAFDTCRNAVLLIEQRRLPHQFKIIATRSFSETAQAIRDMVVRGATAIAAAAAYGLAQGARGFRGANPAQFTSCLETVFNTLKAARPTAVDPANAMSNVRAKMRSGKTVAEQQALALVAAEEFANENVAQCEAIGRQGVKLIRPGLRVLTHCNAGWLACVDVGTATAPLYAAQAQGIKFHVFCDETRPRSQGATLTAWELAQQGIPHQIIADNAAGYLMQRGEIDLVIVGSDRVLGRTGEVANKIGTYTKAVLAHRHKIPFYVAIPLSTIDWNLKSGRGIPIEERDQSEVLGAWGVVENPKSEIRNPKSEIRNPKSEIRNPKSAQPKYVRVANPSSHARNPGFDITPAELITGIITPVGIFKPQQLWSERRRLGFAE